MTTVAVRRAAIVALLTATATVTTGCEYLLFGAPFPAVPAPSFDPSSSFDPTGSLDPTGSFDPGEQLKPLATYAKGHATIAIDGGTPIALDRLSKGPHLYESFGAEVSWSTAGGWYVRVSAPAAGAVEDFAAAVTIDWIKDGRHWSIWDGFESCKVTLTQDAGVTGIAGTATCKGLRWADSMAGPTIDYQPAYVVGQAPFDAVISFEATP